MNPIVISRVSKNRENEHFRSKFQYAVLEKWILEIFEDLFTMILFTKMTNIEDQTKN